MTTEALRQEIAKFPYWYHKIQLAPEVVTPGFEMDELWNHVRKVRAGLDYTDKRVLDIASFDGLFSFEAENLGAKSVVSADCLYNSFANFMFCREVLGSKATPYYNVSPYNLAERLDVYLDESYVGKEDRRFDIVQHLGLLYHLRDPMLSLSQARSVMKEGGHLIIETDVVMNNPESFLLFNGIPNSARIRNNYSVWWAPTKSCLFEMLEATLFEVEESSYSEFEFEPPAREAGKVFTEINKAHVIGRGAVIAKAVAPGKRKGANHEKFETELMRTYRNPGLDLGRL